MANQIKQGAKGQKIGRSKRRPSHSMQAYRTSANRDKRIKRAEVLRKIGSGRKIPSARSVRRAEQSLIYTPRTSDEAKLTLNQRIKAYERPIKAA